jgi:hypothetical protein
MSPSSNVGFSNLAWQGARGEPWQRRAQWIADTFAEGSYVKLSKKPRTSDETIRQWLQTWAVTSCG